VFRASVLNETDTYRELPPPPALRDSLACLWIRRGDGGTVRILPDACSDIVWIEGVGAFVAGPDTRPAFAAPGAGALVVGARFLPGAGGAALGLPLRELRDARVPLAELGLDPDETLGGGATPEDALGLVVALAARLSAAGPPDRAVQAAASRLAEPALRMDRLAAEAGFSDRQLRRRFHVAVGYGPKTLHRILRLRRFLNGAPGGLGRAAAEAGYADQSHLTRECRRLTGLTPGRARELHGS